MGKWPGFSLLPGGVAEIHTPWEIIRLEQHRIDSFTRQRRRCVRAPRPAANHKHGARIGNGHDPMVVVLIMRRKSEDYLTSCTCSERATLRKLEFSSTVGQVATPSPSASDRIDNTSQHVTTRQPVANRGTRALVR